MTLKESRDPKYNWCLTDNRKCNYPKILPPAALPPVPVSDPSQQHHTYGHSTKKIRVCKGKKLREGAHQLERGSTGLTKASGAWLWPRSQTEG